MGLESYLPPDKKDGGENAEPKSKLDDNERQSTPPFNEPVPGMPWGPYGFGSSRTSLAPSTKSRGSGFIEEIRHEVLVNHLFQQLCMARWIGDGAGEREGVLVRKTKGHYLACPANLVASALADGCIALNVPCAMTVNSRVIKTFLAWSNAVDVPLKNGLRVQVSHKHDILSWQNLLTRLDRGRRSSPLWKICPGRENFSLQPSLLKTDCLLSGTMVSKMTGHKNF